MNLTSIIAYGTETIDESESSADGLSVELEAINFANT